MKPVSIQGKMKLVPTVYDVLKLLTDHGWRLEFQAGNFRKFVHHAKPGVALRVTGRPGDELLPEAYQGFVDAMRIEHSERGEPS